MATPKKAPTVYTDFEAPLEQNPRMADHLARFDALKDDMDAKKAEYELAKATYDEVREVILAEAHHVLPQAEGIRIKAPTLLDRPLKMRWQTTTYLDKERLEAEKPEIIAYYSEKRGYWVLERQR